jgi:ADP-heptose:LPS heptosyltransferase
VKRVLVVHTGGGLGDVLLSTPVVEALKDAYPQCQVDFLCRESTSGVLLGNPNITDLLLMQGKGPRSDEARPWIARLRANRYDACIVLWSTTAIAWLMRAARIPVRVGQDSRLAYSFLYTHRVRVRTEHGDVTSHWTDILLDYVRALGVSVGPARVRLDLSSETRARAGDLLACLPSGFPWVGFHCTKGLKLERGRWPIAAFAAMARALEKQLGAQLVLTGGPDEVEIVHELQQMGGIRAALNLAGRTDVPTLAAVAARCQVFVCPDSGPMHLAASQATPVVGIYALDEDFPLRWAPYGTIHRTIRPEHRNCHPGCIKATCPDFRCYYQVDPQAVVTAVGELLQVQTVSRGC